MKKTSLLLVMLAMAFMASPHAQFATARLPQQQFQVNKDMTQKDVAAAKMTPARVITEQPEGTAYEYTRSGRATFGSSDGYVTVDDQDGTVRIVYDPDGTTVYVRNLVYSLNKYFGHTWAQGTVADGVLTIPMGQALYHSPDYNADIILCWGTTYNNNGQIGFTRDETVTEVTYTIGEDGSLTLNNTVPPTTEDPSVIEAYLGTGLTCYWSDNDSWTGFMEWNTVLSDPKEPTEVPTLITEQPEGELFTFLRSGALLYRMSFDIGLGEQESHKIRVVLGEDNKAWIQNPMYWYDYAGVWVEGIYDEATGIITLPVGQYLDYNETYEYGHQMMWGNSVMHKQTNEDGSVSYSLEFILQTDVTEVQFRMDGKKLYLLGTEGDINAEWPANVIATGLYALRSDDQSFDALEFSTEGTLLKDGPAIPADPTDLHWTDGGTETGRSRFSFTLPETDIEGEMIDPELLSYSIFTDDDQIFTFETATYTMDRFLTEDATEIPYSVWSRGIQIRGNGCTFYRTNAEGYEPFFNYRIGVQAIYTVEVPETEGSPKKVPVVNKSNIVYYNLPNTAIEQVNADIDANAPIYNILGQKMSGNLPAGIYIQNGKKFIVK